LRPERIVYGDVMGLVARGGSLAQSYPDGSAGADGFTRWLSRYSERRVVGTLAVAAALIRLYLVITSYCISADGVAYIAMAREFHAGRIQSALAWVFSPLYPWLISEAYRAIPNWELAGELLSMAFGTAGVVLLYFLMREVYGRRGVAAGAAALAAIHPLLAGFSASVRTEAGYIALVTASLLLVVRGVERKRIATVAASGVLCGLGYLYRTEGIGVPALAVIILVAGPFLWRRWTLRWGLGAAAMLIATFLLVAAPYLVWMREYTGHWTVGRELGVVTMEATGSTMGQLERWREMGYRPATSWLTALQLDPAAYLRKVARDFLGSCYSFLQGLGPLLCAALIIGLWTNGKATAARWAEAMLAMLVVMYFVGFVLTDTGPRLMLHVVPFTLGWVAIGLVEAAGWLDARLSLTHSPLGRMLSGPAVVALVAIVLLPRTLFPLGYDQRGMRYAGEEIARRAGGSRATVAGSDVRVAFYADAGFIQLPARPAAGENLCGWLAAHRLADYLMIDDRDERRWGGAGGRPCLNLIQRYPRVKNAYYDLFVVRRTDAVAPRPSAGAGGAANARGSDEGRARADAS
jgi:4-amino-4-deoxy-L-arabinose transferase-like glycosyltransferase